MVVDRKTVREGHPLLDVVSANVAAEHRGEHRAQRLGGAAVAAEPSGRADGGGAEAGRGERGEGKRERGERAKEERAPEAKRPKCPFLYTQHP